MSSLSFFPHAAIRPSQDQLVKDLQEAFSLGKILIAHAPTGLGKTAAALAVAVQHALEKNKRVFFLTNRHTQHQIAVKTLKMMNEKLKNEKSGQELAVADLIGKRWLCSQHVEGLYGNEFTEFCKTVVEKGECEFYNRVRTKNKGLQVEARRVVEKLQRAGPLHTEELLPLVQAEQMCSYEVALELAKAAQVIIGDYNHVFNPHAQNTLFTKLNLELQEVILIVDEGHNLPGRIMEMLSSLLTTTMLRNAVQEAHKFGFGHLIPRLQEMNRALLTLADFSDGKDRERAVGKEDFLNQIGMNNDLDREALLNNLDVGAEEVREKQRKSYLGGIAAFLNSWIGPDQGFVRIVAEKQGRQGPILVLSYSCLDPSIISRDVFDCVSAGVIMSGTLKPTFMYKDLLGIERGQEKEYGSPFPPENKLSVIIPETTTRYTLRGEAMYAKIAQKCSELAGLIPGNVALFFPSYELRDKISGFLVSSKKLFWERSDWRKEEKELFLAEFKSYNHTGAVLLGVAGANFAEGIDLPGNFLNGVVVVGLPLARPDLKTKALIDFYHQKFQKGWEYGYIYPAINKCLQSAGRCIRSETDKGALLFLDERFAWEQYYCCFPREGLKVSKEYGKMIKEFFR